MNPVSGSPRTGTEAAGNGKGQIATEYLIIVSFALMVLIPYMLYLMGISQDFGENNDLQVASNTVQKIGQTADWVYSQGSPSKLRLSLTIPNNVDSIEFVNRTMTWKMRTGSGTSDIYYNSVASLNGSLPTTAGYYNVIIQAVDGMVDIRIVT